ncbi:MAG TPA: glycosyltransferase family 1 protein [Candidatus Dojkabacteria bacterium]|nr:glycosyltransferase family 1 protein [Candidatus Dojkabacteria bacterium]
MRIVIDATTTQNEWKSNGIGFYTRNIATHLISQFPKTNFVLLMYNSPSAIDTFLLEEHSNVEIVRMGEFKGKNLLNPMWYLKQVFPGVEMLKTLKKAYRKGDIFFSPFFWAGLPLSIPFVVTIHDFAFPRFNIYSQISPLHNIARSITYWCEMLKTLKAKSIITDAQFTVDDYLHYLPMYDRSKIFPVHLGLDIELKPKSVDHLLPKDWKERGYIINLGGGYTKNKNVEGIVRSYAIYVDRAKKNGSNPVYLVIAGKNFQDTNIKDVKSLHALIKELNIEDLVHFSGRYDDEDRYSLLANSRLAINLSLYEGFGFALLEGMKAGAPTIASSSSCYPEVVQDGAYLVDGQNYNEVAGAIIKLLEDEPFSRNLAIKGKEVAYKYSWEKCAKHTHEILINAAKK